MYQKHGPHNTGSQISFLNLQVEQAGEIWLNCTIRLFQAPVVKLYRLLEILTLDFVIAGREFKQDSVLAAISEPMILGVDFMVKYEASWDWRKNQIVYRNWVGPRVHCCAVKSVVRIVPNQITCCRTCCHRE